MSDKKYQTIVITYEGDKPPLLGFGVPVLGCEVTSIAMGDPLHELDGLMDAAESKLGEDSDEFADMSHELNSAMEQINHLKVKLKALLKS